MIGATDGYSNGRDDVYLWWRHPSGGQQRNGNQRPVDIGEDAVAVKSGPSAALGGLPSGRSTFKLPMPCGFRWLSDAAGRIVLDGYGEPEMPAD